MNSRNTLKSNLESIQQKAKERTVKTQNVEYDLETLVKRIRTKGIKLDPDYQRRHRWPLETSSRLIESLILNIPIPYIFISQDVDVDDEVETLDALKEKIKTRLEESKKHEAEHNLRDTVVEKAAANAEVEIPEVIVTNEVNRMLQEFEQRLQMQGMNLELYFQFSGQDENALREQMKEEAQTRVKVNLTLEAIAKAENLEVTDEDVNAELEKMAGMYNMTVDSIKQALGGAEGIKADLKLKKAVDFLVENKK